MSYSKKKYYPAKFYSKGGSEKCYFGDENECFSNPPKIFVLKIGGEIVAEKSVLEAILKDIKELVESGIKIILVHGGGKQADILSAQIGHTPVKINGRRVTSQQDLEIAKMLYGGSLNLEILSIMKKLKMKGIRVSGLDGNLLEVHIRDTKKFDFGFVGDIDFVHPQVLLDLLAKGYIPVVSPLACNKNGVILNINADTIASSIAATLKTEKLIVFTNTQGVYHHKKLLNVLTLEEAAEILLHSIAKDGMAVKITNAIYALKGGVKRVHIINGLSKHSLLKEVLTKKGIGTMITTAKEKQLLKFPPNIAYIEGKKNGPCVVIMGSVHGDERIGAEVVSRLAHDIKPENLHGKLILIIGNPAAYADHKRFIHSDLNRLFGSRIKTLMKKPTHTLNIEEKRAVELAPFLQEADYLLDIHSTIKPSAPFVYCQQTNAHFALAYAFETEYVVSPASNFQISDLTSCSDNYVDQHGGIGITYEAGWQRGLTLFPEVMAKTYRFLSAAGSLKSVSNKKTSKIPKKVLIHDSIIPESTHFHFKKNFSNFDVVEKGEVIAEDDGTFFKAKKKSFTIFPKIDIIPGTPACYLGSL